MEDAHQTEPSPEIMGMPEPLRATQQVIDSRGCYLIVNSSVKY